MRARGVRLPTDVAVDLLCANPESGTALKGELAGWRSLRVGRLRIVYREARKQIEVATIGPRASIYFETTRRLRRRIVN